MSRTIILFLLVTISYCSVAQDSVKAVADELHMNINGRLYLVYESEISEIDRLGNEILKYTLSPPDVIDYCDVSNPLEIIVYNRSRNRVCILDDKLNPISDNISFFRNEDVNIVCSSSYGGMWYFGNDSRQFFHYDNKGVMKLKSQLLFGIQEYKNDLPDMLIETKEYLFAGFPESGVMVFDRNAQFIKTIKCDDYRLSYAQGRYVVLVKKGKVKIIEIESGVENNFDVPESIKQAFINNSELVLFNGEKIFFKKMNKN